MLHLLVDRVTDGYKPVSASVWICVSQDTWVPIPDPPWPVGTLARPLHPLSLGCKERTLVQRINCSCPQSPHENLPSSVFLGSQED